MKLRKEAGIRCALAFALLGALFTTFEAAATCYAPNNVPPGTSTYDAYFPVGNTRSNCPATTSKWLGGTQVFQYALTLDEAASPASVICSDFSGGNYCEAWPQGSQITYTWKATGGVTLDYVPAPTDSSVILNCTSYYTGMGRVTVYAPGWGAPQKAASVAYCGNQ